MKRNTRWRAVAGPTGALLVLSGLWAAGVLQADLLPDLLPIALPPLERQAIPMVLFASVAASAALLRRLQGGFRTHFRNALPIAAGLFLAPSALVYFSQGWMPPLTRAAIFTLVPVFAVVMEPYMGGGEDSRPRNALFAGLAGAVGAFLVFPAAIPQSVGSALSFAAVTLAAASVAWANCRAVRVFGGLPRGSGASLSALTGGLATAGMVAGSIVLEHPILTWRALRPVLLRSAAVEVPGLLLLFWLMGRMSATRMTTRYIFAPLLAILAGAASLGSLAEVRPRTWVGLALMAAGASWLLLAREEMDAEPTRIPLDGSPR